MGSIMEMPQGLREKIAAGEVITAPSSVAKELIENALDAGATEIKVHIEKGGKRLLRVSDNGSGIGKDDLEVCARRFTTSKIKGEEDLERIGTLGFRGEALASIAAVAELRIESNGLCAQYDEHGEPAGGLRKSQAAKGTVVEVRNLFSRLPVRLKFLKSDEVEAAGIVAHALRYSLAAEGTSIEVYKDGKLAFNSPKGKLIDRIFNAFGREVADNVVQIEFSADGVRVRGYASKAGYSRKTRDYQAVFVNGRHVKCKLLTDAAEKGYSGGMFLGRFPVLVLKVDASPNAIDVNVHPSKEEIKFRDGRDIADAVRGAIGEALLSSSGAISTGPDSGPKIGAAARHYPMKKGMQSTLQPQHSAITPAGPGTGRREIQKQNHELESVNVIAQANKTYIIGQDAKGLLIIDQHAAQERIFYEMFKSEIASGAVARNELIQPYVFTGSPGMAQFISKNRGVIGMLGFAVDEFGKNEFALTSVPAVFGNTMPPDAVRDVIDELMATGVSGALDDEISHRVATRACRRAVKGGDELAIPQMRKILDGLAKCSNPYTCPHGRPTVIRMGWPDIEKKFKRKE